MHTQNEINNQNEQEMTVLIWKVEENSPESDHLKCGVYENDHFLYNIPVLKNENLKNAKPNDVIKSAKVFFNFLSPDGISISMDDFPTEHKALLFFEQWKKQFERQGYYSSNDYGRIPLDVLHQFCEAIRYVEE